MDVNKEIKISVRGLFHVWNDAMIFFAEAAQKKYGIEKVEVLAAPLNDKFKHIIKQIEDGEYPNGGHKSAWQASESSAVEVCDIVYKEAAREVGNE